MAACHRQTPLVARTRRRRGHSSPGRPSHNAPAHYPTTSLRSHHSPTHCPGQRRRRRRKGRDGRWSISGPSTCRRHSWRKQRAGRPRRGGGGLHFFWACGEVVRSRRAGSWAPSAHTCAPRWRAPVAWVMHIASKNARKIQSWSARQGRGRRAEGGRHVGARCWRSSWPADYGGRFEFGEFNGG